MISTTIGVGIIRNSTRHSRKTQEVHWKEGNVYANKEGSEMDLRQNLVIGNSKDFVGSVVKPGEDRKYCPH